MRRIFTLMLFIMLYSFVGYNQTNLFTEEFDNNTQYSVTLGAEGNDGAADYFQRTDGSNINITYSSYSGTYFFAGQDIDDGGWTGSASPSELTWTGINISGYINLQFKGYFASYATNYIDDNDYVHVQYRIDGGTWTDLIWFENDGSTYNTYFLEDTDFSGDGDGTQLTSTFSQFVKNISGSGSTLDLRITVAANAGGEDIAYDLFEVYGDLANSNDLDAYAADTGSQPTGANISPVNNNSASNSLAVFNMDIYDGGTSDGLSTHVTNIRLKPNPNANTATWSANIGGVVINDGSNDITPATLDVTDTYMDIGFNSGDLDIADNSQKTITVKVYLNTSGVEDGEVLSFMVDVDDHGFTADNSGTGFKVDFGGGDFYSNDFPIAVVATELRYDQQPTNTEVNATMSPDVVVVATDVYGNVDADFSSDISLSSTGTMTGDPIVETANAGYAFYSSIVHTATGTGLTLNAERDGTGDWDVTSDQFDITPGCTNATANINEFHYDNDGTDANEFVEVYIEDPQPGDKSLYSVVLYNGSDGSQYASETLDNMTATAGTGGTFYVWEPASIQNGAPDGIALGGECGLMEFLSYEGTFTASGGIADGVSSDDIGVEESASTPLNSSIQLVNGSWLVTDGSNTKGAENTSAQFISILDFSARKVNNTAILSWSTASEINNDYFALEWSRDGKNFKEIAKIDSKGNYRENKEYSYIHITPAPGTNYYRLTQYDLDGRSTAFDVVSVHFDSSEKTIFIVPNRVENNMRVEFTQPVDNGRLLIYSIEGQMVQSNILAKGIDVINLDVAGLAAGQYIVKYVDTTGTITKKFVKL